MARARTTCIACSVFKDEIESLRTRGELNLALRCFPSSLHTRPQEMHSYIDDLIRESRTRGEKVLLLAGDCHPYMNEQEAAAGVCRVRGVNCAELLLGKDRYQTLLREGTFFVLPEWSSRWRELLHGSVGLPEEAEREFMAEFHSKIVYLDTGCAPVSHETLAEASLGLGLPYEVIEVGLEPLLAVIREALARSRSSPVSLSQEVSSWDPATHAMAVDLLVGAVAKVDDPVALGQYVALELRELTGARAVTVLQCIHLGSYNKHEVIGIEPRRHLGLVEAPVAERLAQYAHDLQGPAILREESLPDDVGILETLPAGWTVVAPLRVANQSAGCVALLGLPEDESSAKQLVRVLEMLTRVMGPVFRSAFLHERQEQIIELRTQELRLRAAQQAGIAELGQFALSGMDLQAVLDKTAVVLANGLAVEYVKLLEFLADEGKLLLRAGVGWRPGLVGTATVDCGSDSQAGYTLIAGRPVIVESLADETRFRAAELLLTHGVVSGLSVAIGGRDRPFGVLGAHSAIRRVFSDDDVHFLEAAASVLGEAIEIRRAEATVSALNVDLERRVVERTAELERAVDELRSFSYSVSHDLRQPLRIVASYSQLLVEEASDKLGDDCLGYVERIQAGVRRLTSVIEGLLKLSRLGRQKIEHTRIDLSALARNVLAEIQTHGQDKGIEFRIEDGMHAVGDPELITQLLQNLIDNACKFSAGRPRARVELSTHRMPDGGIAYCVQDNGVGFDMQYADKLFRAFERLHDADHFEGTGIGLATVARIVQLHGGRVWAEAAVDEGARFYFTIAAPTG